MNKILMIALTVAVWLWFSGAAPAAEGEHLYEAFVHNLSSRGIPVETGAFGADMAVELVNDGPVTIWMES